MGPTASSDWCGKSRSTGIRSPDRPARSRVKWYQAISPSVRPLSVWPVLPMYQRGSHATDLREISYWRLL